MELRDLNGRVQYIAHIPAAAAADATADVAMIRLPYKCRVKKISYVALTTVTGADTNSRNINAKVGATEIGNVDFTSGVNATAKTLKDLTLTATTANLDRAAGDIVAFESEKVGTGLATTAGIVLVEIEGN